MEYKKIEYDNYVLHLINSDRFKTMSINLFLSKLFDKNDIAPSLLLTRNLTYSSKKYNTKSKIATKAEDLYGAKVFSSYSGRGNIQTISFELNFLNPKYTENKYLDDSLDFLCEVLFNPNIENNGFKKEYFDIIKTDIISSINSIKDNPNIYAGHEYNKVMYKNTPSEYSYTPEISDIAPITPSSLYKFYNKIFNNEYRIDIVVFGEIDDIIISKITKRFKNILGTKDKLDLMVTHKYSTKLREKIDTLPYNQSKLYIGYRVNNVNYHELNHVLKVYNTILGTMHDSLLFNVVREKNSLCYSIGSFYSKYNPSLTIYAGINKDNYEKSVKLIKECVNMMKDKKVIDKLFIPAKKTINTYLNTYYDDDTAQINKYYYDQFTDSEDIETYRDNINNVTIEEIIDLNKKISISTIYLLKGVNND